MTRLLSFVLAVLVLMTVGCGAERSKAKLRPMTGCHIRYEAGDDGHIIFNLRFRQDSTGYSALETMRRNWEYPEHYDTLYNAHLSDSQLTAARTFVAAAADLRAGCPQTTTLDECLRVDCDGETIEVRGNCDWGKADYGRLRKTVLGMDRATPIEKSELRPAHR